MVEIGIWGRLSIREYFCVPHPRFTCTGLLFPQFWCIMQHWAIVGAFGGATAVLIYHFTRLHLFIILIHIYELLKKIVQCSWHVSALTTRIPIPIVKRSTHHSLPSMRRCPEQCRIARSLNANTMFNPYCQCAMLEELPQPLIISSAGGVGVPSLYCAAISSKYINNVIYTTIQLLLPEEVLWSKKRPQQ